MKLLIVTQAVDRNDPVLGFFHRWLLEFARHVDSLVVICLYEGAHDLPENVRVYSLGKEKGRRPALVYTLRFLRLAWRLRADYDAVFVHMNAEYLVIAGLLWKFLGKPTALWYMHKTVSLRLQLGVLFADRVFTASPKSMRAKTKKKRVVGHGIDVATLAAADIPPYPPLSLITIGRLSRVKRVDILVNAVAMLRESGIDAHFTVYGGPATEDGERYLTELKGQTEGLGMSEHVSFAGALPHARLPEAFEKAHLFLHASNTGSLDKASLEPLAAGVPVVTSDSELAEAGIPSILLATPDPESFAGVVRKAVGKRVWEDQSVRESACRFVRENHELPGLIERILADSVWSGHRRG